MTEVNRTITDVDDGSSIGAMDKIVRWKANDPDPYVTNWSRLKADARAGITIGAEINPPPATQAELEAGTVTAERTIRPSAFKAAVETLAGASGGGGGGLTTVSSDATLSGQGTSGSPLQVANPFTAADEAKLDAIESNAKADQTGLEIVALLEALTGTNRLDEDALEGGLSNARVLTSSDNLNSVGPGFYKWAASVPANATGTHGALMAFARSDSPDINIQIECRAPAGIPQMRFRSYNGGDGTWRPWSVNAVPPIVSQAVAEAGTSTEEFTFTPQRIAQMIAALAPAGGGGGSGDITAVNTGSASGMSGGAASGAVNLQLDLDRLLTVGPLTGSDKLAFVDASNSNVTRKATFAVVANLLAGTNLSASNGVLSVSGTLPDARIPSSIARDSEVTTAISNRLQRTDLLAGSNITLTPGSGNRVTISSSGGGGSAEEAASSIYAATFADVSDIVPTLNTASVAWSNPVRGVNEGMNTGSFTTEVDGSGNNRKFVVANDGDYLVQGSIALNVDSGGNLHRSFLRARIRRDRSGVMATLGFEGSSGYARNQYGVSSEHLVASVNAIAALESGDKVWIEYQFVGQNTSIEGTLVGSSSGIQFSRQDVVGGGDSSSGGTGDIESVNTASGSGLAGGSASGDVNLRLNIENLTTSNSLDGADKIGYVDSSQSNAMKKATIAGLANKLAGNNLTASNGVLSVSGVGDVTAVNTGLASGLAGGGTSGAINLRLDIANLASVTTLNAGDEFPFADDSAASDATRKVTLEHLAQKLAGNNLTASNGVLNAAAGGGGGSGDVTGVNTSATSGLSGGGSSGEINLQLDIQRLSAVTTLQANDEFVIADDSATNDPSRKITLANIANKLAGSNITASNGVLNATGDITQIVTNSSSGLSGGVTSGSANLRLHVFDLPVLSGTLSANDTFAVADEDTAGDPTRKVSMQTISTKLAGTGLSAANGTLNFSLPNNSVNTQHILDGAVRGGKIPQGGIGAGHLANVRMIDHARLTTTVSDALVPTPGSGQTNGQVLAVDKTVTGHMTAWQDAGDKTGASQQITLTLGSQQARYTGITPPTGCKTILASFKISSRWTKEISVAYTVWNSLTARANNSASFNLYSVCEEEHVQNLIFCIGKGASGEIAVSSNQGGSTLINIRFVT